MTLSLGSGMIAGIASTTDLPTGDNNLYTLSDKNYNNVHSGKGIIPLRSLAWSGMCVSDGSKSVQKAHLGNQESEPATLIYWLFTIQATNYFVNEYQNRETDHTPLLGSQLRYLL